MAVILNTTKSTVLAAKAGIADTFISRMTGLLGRAALPADEALIITKCNSIHMFFMRFAIDAIFVDKNNGVVGLVRNIKPFRISPIFFRASYVIETLPGVIDQTKTSLNDQIVIKTG